MSRSTDCHTNFAPGVLNHWPPKLPDAVLDYSLNITQSIDPLNDFVTSAAVSIAPSGVGELTASNLYITNEEFCGIENTILTTTLSGGIPGRSYVVKFDVSMTDGRLFSFLVYIDVPKIIAGGVASVPPSTDFGTPVTSTGGNGNPVISYTGVTTSPFEFLVYPSLGIYLDGNLTYPPSPTIDYVGGATQNSLNSLTVANASAYIDVAGFNLTASQLTTLSFPNMTNWTGAFNPTMATLSTLSVPLLEFMNGAFTPTFAAMTNLSLPSLLTMSGNFHPVVPSLQTFSMNPHLEAFNGNFTLAGSLIQTSVDGILVALSLLNGTGNTQLYNGRTVNLSGGTNSTPSAVGLAAKVLLQAAACTVTTN